MQQRFDAASEAVTAGRCAEAVPELADLEDSPTARKNAMVRAVIVVRKGLCLAQLGRAEEAQSVLRDNLPLLEAQGQTFNRDIHDGHLTLGRLAAQRLDYEEAIGEAREALALAAKAGRIAPLAELARLTAFDSGPEPLAYANEMLALFKADPQTSKDQLSRMHTLRARILMNQGRHQEAYDELKTALKLSGGLSLKVSLADVAMRGDLAQAAVLLGKKSEARKYLAYTGAGRTPDAPFERAESMEPPPCGADGLSPSDVAIVDFNLSDNGSVSAVAPIYATGGRAHALAFARAVSEWTWSAKNVAAIPAFYRHGIRVEIRCSTASLQPGLELALETAAGTWLQTQPLAATQPLAVLTEKRANLARTEKAGAGKPLLAALADLGSDDLAPPEERMAASQKAMALAPTLGAPPTVITMLNLHYLAAQAEKRRWSGRGPDRAALRALLAQPAIADDPLSAATVRMKVALPSYRSPAAPDAEQLFSAVLDDSRLPANHPLKVDALLQLATLRARQGNMDGARTYFEKTGLTEQQCALVGTPPVMKSSGASSEDYPHEAWMMGFQGWVRTEYDITPDGRTLNQRALIAYPPFMFNDAAVGIARTSRFQTSYRPSSNAACGGARSSIFFRGG